MPFERVGRLGQNTTQSLLEFDVLSPGLVLLDGLGRQANDVEEMMQRHGGTIGSPDHVLLEGRHCRRQPQPLGIESWVKGAIEGIRHDAYPVTRGYHRQDVLETIHTV